MQSLSHEPSVDRQIKLPEDLIFMCPSESTKIKTKKNKQNNNNKKLDVFCTFAVDMRLCLGIGSWRYIRVWRSRERVCRRKIKLTKRYRKRYRRVFKEEF